MAEGGATKEGDEPATNDGKVDTSFTTSSSSSSPSVLLVLTPEEEKPSLERDERNIKDSQNVPLSTKDDEAARMVDEKVVAKVDQTLEILYKDSAIFSSDGSAKKPGVTPVPELDWNELKIGELLGKGGFNTVHSVRIPGSDEEYALKALHTFKNDGEDGDDKDGSDEDEENKRLLLLKRIQGAADLTVEGCFLATVTTNHKNIVKLHARSKPHSSRPFLVLDKLSGTLDKRMLEWKVEEDETLLHLSHRPKLLEQTRKSLISERLLVAMDIARALHHLHKHKVVYRDLKPENVGFGQDENTVVLFDLGLAKELKAPLQLQTGKYKLTGETGSWCYMAPEVAKGWNYDASVDIYSFGILLWELTSLSKAFGHLTDVDDYKKRVVAGEERPKLDPYWPASLQRLIQKCWAYFAAQRPKWDTILETLQDVVEDNPILQHHTNNHHPHHRHLLSAGGAGAGVGIGRRSRQNTGNSVVDGDGGGGSRRRHRNARSNTLTNMTGFFMGNGNKNDKDVDTSVASDDTANTATTPPHIPRHHSPLAGGGGTRPPGRWMVSNQIVPNQTATSRQRAPRMRRLRQATADDASRRQLFFTAP